MTVKCHKKNNMKKRSPKYHLAKIKSLQSQKNLIVKFQKENKTQKNKDK